MKDELDYFAKIKGTDFLDERVRSGIESGTIIPDTDPTRPKSGSVRIHATAVRYTGAHCASFYLKLQELFFSVTNHFRNNNLGIPFFVIEQYFFSQGLLGRSLHLLSHIQTERICQTCSYRARPR